MRRCVGFLLAFWTAGPAPAPAQERSAAADWPTYNRDLAGTRYSPLDRIDTGNVGELQEVWSYRFHPEDGFIEGPSPAELFQQVTPIVVDGVMYLAAGNRVVALRPETGAEIWRHELRAGLASFRGVAYGPATGAHGPRIYFTSLSKVVALHAGTGERDVSFGDRGEVELRIPYTGVPVVYRDVLVLGSSAFGPGQEHIAPHLNQPRGGGEPEYAYPRALDAAGALLWEFPTLPTESDFGSHTWGGQSWRNRIGNNVWAFTLTVDEERGLVYLPVSSPGSNFYGGDRPGDNLFANSTVAVDARTGELAWYFQNIHHELWDYNLPPAPGLFEIERGGERIPALAQVGKSAFMFILNRVTGEPIHGVEERPVAASDVPGEATWPTQPIPVKPPPLGRVRYEAADLVTAGDTTPEHAAACAALVDSLGEIRNAGPFTPWVYRPAGAAPRTTLNFPGGVGGPNWGGVSFDPATGYAFVFSMDVGALGWMVDAADEDAPSPYVKQAPRPASFEVDLGGVRMPCQKPPWGQLTAVDVATGDVAWRRTLGVTDALPEGKRETGRPGRAAAIVTAGGLLFIAATDDNRLRALEAATGRELWADRLERRGNADPLTWLGADGRQYVAIVATDTLVAYALP